MWGIDRFGCILREKKGADEKKKKKERQLLLSEGRKRRESNHSKKAALTCRFAHPNTKCPSSRLKNFISSRFSMMSAKLDVVI
jgi:hypothetical protein